MREILSKYCSDQISETGLFLFNPPTGTGKTHRVLEYIYENYQDYCKEGRKIFFITNLKKNLPWEDLQKNFFLKNNQLKEYDENVMVIDSNQEYILKNFLNVVDEIDSYFHTAEFKEIKKRCHSIKKFESKPDMSDVVDEWKNQIREKLEPEFRKRITEFLKKQFHSKKERLKAIQYDEKYKWIGKLYPTVFTDKRKIYFLSIDKFFAKNTTLIEPSYYFFDHKITQKCLLFIDEFDSTKDAILSNIIEKGINQRIDFIQLFNGIHLSLLNNVFPKQILEPSKAFIRKKETLTKLQEPSDQIIEFNKIASKICKDFNLKTSYKTEGSKKLKESRSLLFHDFRYHAVLKDDKKFISITYKPDLSINHINFTNDRPVSKNSIILLLNNLRGFINYFQKGVKHLAKNYYELKNETSTDIEYSYESALLTILEEFALDPKHKKFIIENILSERELPKLDLNKLQYDLSIYQQGFRYYDFVDNDEHDTITKTYLYSFQNSPEKFILKLAEKSKVIGISATSTLETVTGNYDCTYLSNQLGKKFFHMSHEEIKRLKDEFNEQYPNYTEKVKIHAHWLEKNKENPLNDWINLFEDEEIANEVYGKLYNDEFFRYRFYKIGYAFKQFLTRNDIQAFLCLLNSFPQTKSSEFNKRNLEEIFNRLIELHKCQSLFEKNDKFDVSNSYTIIKSKDYDAQKEGLIKKIEEGQKIFIISTYQTIGAGQNLQFTAPNPTNLVKFIKHNFEDWNKGNKTDINAIYLDNPTHLLVNANTKALKEFDFAKYLFQLEFLQEHGDISMEQLNKQVKIAFTNLISSTHSKNKAPLNLGVESLYKKHNYSQHISKIVIQALGRLCRTNLKSKDVYIFADSDIYPHLQTVDTEKQICLWEFLTLRNTKPNSYVEISKNESLDRYNNLANTISRKTNSLIKRLIESEWSSNRIEDWKKLREMVLHLPIMTSDEAQFHTRFRQLYIELPDLGNSYTYDKTGDYDETTIDFSKTQELSVSQSSIRLNELMKIPGVKAHFQDNKWATEFKLGNYIITPILFNNIYKGALGEVVGKFILEYHMGIKLHDIEEEDYFELFDYKINDKIYVDFKFWKETTSFSSDEEKIKINKKLDKIGGDKVFIINILSNNEYKIMRSHDKRIIEIPYLFNIESQQLNKEALTEIANHYSDATY